MKKKTKKLIKRIFLYIAKGAFSALVLGTFEIMILYGLTISPTIIK